MENLKEILEFDGLYEAEKLTGKSYKTDKLTESIGILASIENSQSKNEILKANNDSNRDTTITEMIRYMEELGFTKLYSKTINYKERNELYEKVTQYYYWNYKKFVLAVFESYPPYNSDDYGINSAKMYYAVKAPYENLIGKKSSGCYDSENGVWNGDHDIRDAFKFKFNELDKAGEFVPWTGKNFLWLCTYVETNQDNYDSDEIREEVLSHLQEDVKSNMKWYK